MSSRPRPSLAARCFVAGLLLPGAVHGASDTDPLAPILHPAVTATVDSIARRKAGTPRYSDDDFPLPADAFATFRREVSAALERSLGLEGWAVRIPGGAARPSADRFTDRKLATVDRDGVRLEGHTVEILDAGLRVPIVVCLPGGSDPRPGILVLSGHSLHGLRDLVLDLASYQRGIATRLAQAGFVAVAVEKVDSGYLARTFGAGSDEDLVA